ncbi:MAG TPA: amino acid-binding protein [Phycisphaerales bacterium]|nr:MAG: amino acid-binding protein [Planctomycetes bacterium GWC2_45_44]HBG77589.1 amino acid-binding protein [Phycisphaerales bacterium]HBR20335.1 amino acid-binding protein [Phycisphaerales bacterium]
MKIKQISIFLENRKGRLFDVCSLLGKHNINIRALNVAETESFGILRIVVNNPDDAVKKLAEAGFTANITDVIAVEVPDKPGGLAGILKVLNDEDVNVEYMYGFVEKATDKALMVFRFDNADRATAVLKKHDIRIAGEKEIKEL